ncbi:hypothetical protein Z946_3958 [Sulfitobacter noctilucicola]|uniref:Uncharacterized protein n=1 Tax=Sulfitobacter noctilucicola TaxID=1342301 RepID=A0A7W6Q5I5_9RHOB|nr:hypothetical protein [Sulfitobacter noctilucicola]KIN65060.1 hypothetical protein Z946_3958 [Sulfitobacter noctilucicola]MBB4173800.1 hypothetical protein [Sulfitobacter noctilucicola]
MSEFQVLGPDLKKLLTVAKRQPIAFAFNPAKKDEDHFFSMDRKKPADVLGRDAKKNGESGKVAFGTATVESKLLRLTCEQQVPGIAKKLKKFLKTQKLSMNIEVLDANGAVLEADVSDIPDDPDEEAEAPNPQAAGSTDDETGAEATPAADLSDLIARLNQCKPKVQAAPQTVVALLTKMFTETAGLIKAGDIAGAQARLDKLEAALAKVDASEGGAGEPAQLDAKQIQGDLVALGARIKTLPPEHSARLAAPMKQAVDLFKAGELAKTQAATIKISAACDTLSQSAAAPKVDDTAKLANRARALRDAIAGLTDEALAKRLMVDLGQGAQQIKAGEGQSATETFDGIEKAIEQAAASTDTGAQARWEAHWPDLGPRADVEINAKDGPMAQTVKARKMAAEDAATAGDYDKAVTIAERLEDTLKEAYAARMEAGEAKKDRVSAVDFAKARITWRDARTELRTEMKTLADAIIGDLKGGDVDGIDGAVEELYSYLDPITDRLETALNKLMEATEPEAIETLKQASIKLIGELQQELEQGIFADIDDNNGFTNVSVQKKAMTALGAVADEINQPPKAA